MYYVLESYYRIMNIVPFYCTQGPNEYKVLKVLEKAEKDIKVIIELPELIRHTVDRV